MSATAEKSLTALDRCDRCGAQAYLRVTLGASAAASLLFCGHHAEEHRGKLEELAANGAEVLDELPEVSRRPIAVPKTVV